MSLKCLETEVRQAGKILKVTRAKCRISRERESAKSQQSDDEQVMKPVLYRWSVNWL